VILGYGGIGLLLASLAYVALNHQWRAVDDKVYVIGWNNSPPFQERATDGSPAGLVIDLIENAARRRGIRLKWAWHPEGPDAALRNRDVDLWPLMTITPERQRVNHISKPYLEHDYDLLVRANRGYSKSQDLSAASITYIWMPLHQRFLKRLLPHARLVPVASGEEGIEDVCAGRSDAAFLDEFTASTTLLGGAACTNQRLRVISVPTLRTELGVGSTLQASVAADEIRRGIDDSVMNGDLVSILRSGGYLSLHNMRYFTALLNTQRREKWLKIIVVVFACLLALTIFAADRIRRQRDRIRVTEGVLRQSEQRFRELLENTKLVAIMTDPNGTISFWNDHAAAITGWSSEEAIGRPAKQFLDFEFPPPEISESAGPLSVRQTSPLCEGALLQKNGDHRWIQWSSTLLRDSAGAVAGMAALGEDVTELRRLRAEAARLESEEQFRAIADTTPLMIWTAGGDVSCTFVNKAWLSFTGRNLQDELGKGWTASIHPDDSEYVNSIIQSASEAHRSLELEYRKRRFDGEYRWVLGSGVPRFGSDGRFLGYIGTCTDITDLKLSRDEDMARQKLETVGGLASGIAHDFNNILGGVLAQAELALAEAPTGVFPDNALRDICDIALRGAAIVKQLMIYAGQENAAPEPVDMSWLVDDMDALLKVVVSKHVLLKTQLSRNIPAVQANLAELRQVVMNLVTNASEAIGQRDGMIFIRTDRTSAAGGPPLKHHGDCVLLEVSDTGGGISRDVRPRLFDPFFTTKTVGQGLGLAVVQRIVRSLGGTIEIESDPGRGSTFRILLPCLNKAALRPDPAKSRGNLEETHPAPTILIVEDEEQLRFVTAKMLRRNGFGVVEAADGTEALATISAHKERIDVVLLDVTLPGAPSRDVLAEVRRVRPDTKVIVTTAYGTNKVAETFPGMHIDSFLRKPYRAADLINVALSLCPAAHTSDAQSDLCAQSNSRVSTS
jgi:PAS domain S-box-containing protein